VLHLDVKPENVILHEGSPVVTDFGLSVLANREGAGSRAEGGTPAYMAPEQRRGEALDARADVYALGRMLARMLDGRPGTLRSVVERATADLPARRYANVRELLRDVDRHLGRRRRIARLAAACAAVTVAASLALFVVDPPAGGRAPFRRDVWGDDVLPRSAWNVAFDPSGKQVSLAASHPGFACGQSLAELVDGLNVYQDWQHGFAFPPRPPGICVNLDVVGTCGERRPDAHLCAKGPDGQAAPLADTVSSVEGADRERTRDLGQWTEGVPCGERWIEIDLGAERSVRAVRTWHHGLEHVPRRERIAVAEGAGWRDVVKTPNVFIVPDAWNAPLPGYVSGPVTLDFAPVKTRRVRWTMDSCSVDSPLGHGWLYEIEVFADISRVEAWYRWLFARE